MLRIGQLFGAKFKYCLVVHFSELLRMVLFVLDEGVAHLETYVEFPGKEALQRSCLFALQVRTTSFCRVTIQVVSNFLVTPKQKVAF